MEPQETTRALVEKAQNGDRRAFGTLLERYRGQTERFVHTDMGRHLKQQADLEDVVQETSLRAFRSIQGFQYHDDQSFPRWLASIARHVVLELAGKQQRSRKLQLTREVGEGEVSPSRAARRSERFDRLEKALDQLSGVHREVILLARIKGLRIKEIATRMDRSENAILLLLSRALKKLKDSFGDTESLHLPEQRLDRRSSDD